MIVAHWEGDGQLAVYADPHDFTDEQQWRWRALGELAKRSVTHAWTTHSRFHCRPEVELAVLLLLGPVVPANVSWVLPSRAEAEHALLRQQYPVLLLPAPRAMTSAWMQKSRDQAIDEQGRGETVVGAELMYQSEEGETHIQTIDPDV